ncbi:MAG: DNA mismatch endonuclease Vsr [Methanimicrococcus sp.]|nr:DNA mismatch endonuclease Vsr [Methanimicrococcus sp.]
MADKLTPEQRRKNMQAVKNKGSEIERLLQEALTSKGYTFETNDRSVFGNPDIVFHDEKVAIFCDSEYWHGWNWEVKKHEIKSNQEFWIPKIERNMERDREVNEYLEKEGWTVLRFWGKEIKKETEKCFNQIEKEIGRKKMEVQPVKKQPQKEIKKPKQKKILYSEISNNLNLNKINEDDRYKISMIGHYLQVRETPASYYYEKNAQKYLNDFGFDFENTKIEWDIPFPTPKNSKFTFIDLFAGIGGFRIAFQNLGGKCVFSSEWDKYAQQTYEKNFGEVPFGDITKINERDIPDHDILCAGFPCQAFSIAGKRGGFEDTRGTLFFDVARIIKEKKPKAFFLENVKGLVSHDRGKTLKTILSTLREDLDYYVPDPQILNAKDFGVPQNRERIFIVGFRKDTGIEKFVYPKPIKAKKTFEDVKEREEVSVKYYLSTQYLSTLRKHRERHLLKGNGFGYEIISDNSVANAIVVGGMGRERNLVIDNRLTNFIPVTNIKGEVNREGVRRMTPREWARLQGYPDEFRIVVADVNAYKQFGNSVSIPAIQKTGKMITDLLGYTNGK